MFSLRVLIAGIGSIGRRHLGNLRKITPDARITLCRRQSREQDPAQSEADKVVNNLAEALDPKPDLALITSPASLHIEASLLLARRGVHLFIEKPLADKLDGVDELIEECARQNLVLMIGYNLRFNLQLQAIRKAIQGGLIGRVLNVRAEVGQYLPDWRPAQDYAKGVSARRDLGGGAVLELSHELDYIRWLVGEVTSVSAQIDKLSDLDIDVEDTAEIILKFSAGAIGSVHLDMVRRPPARTCQIIGSEGSLTWDGLENEARIFSQASNKWSNLGPDRATDSNEMYVEELRHFIDCVDGGGAPAVTGEDGKRALEIALAVKRSSKEQRVIQV